MSVHFTEVNGLNDTNSRESLKVWNCINCRRRKVRCDRHHPCAPCTKNKVDCVFPVSGRIPRRSRVTNHANSPAQRRAEVVSRLRRLEAMIGDLGSQAEYAGAEQNVEHPVEGTTNATIATSAAIAIQNENDWLNNQSALHGQRVTGNTSHLSDGVQTSFDMDSGTSASPQVRNEFGELAVTTNTHGDLVVGDRFWTVFCREVEDIFEAVGAPNSTHLHGYSNSSPIAVSEERGHTGFYNFLLKHTSAEHQRQDLRLLPSQMLFLWEIYTDNVDPFMKILHKPTMTKIIRELRGSYYALSFSMKALLSAVSLVAIVSLADEEVQTTFNADKGQLVTSYRLGTEKAIEKADFLNNPDMNVLQALTLYLGFLQNVSETSPAWLLTGVLVRVAVSMNLHRDGSLFANVTPFEVELRRRLWWQICLIDSRSAEGVQVSEFKISERMFNTKIPANVDDEYIDPGMSESPVLGERWTDMTIFLIRCEIWKLSRRLQSATPASDNPSLDADERLELFRHIQSSLENTYLRHLNPDRPLHCFVLTNIRLFLAKVRLILIAKQQSTRVTERHRADSSQGDELFVSSLSIIEYTYALQNEPDWSCWRWQVQGRQPPWHALRIILSQLTTRRWDSTCMQAWLSAQKTLDRIPEASREDSRYQQLLELAFLAQRDLNGESQRRIPGSSMNAHFNLTSATPTTLSTSLENIGISKTNLDRIPSQPSSVIADRCNNLPFSNEVPLEMDWQAWDEMTGKFEPSFDFWDMSGL